MCEEKSCEDSAQTEGVAQEDTHVKKQAWGWYKCF